MTVISQVAEVDVTSAWYSKVNWVAGAVSLAGVLTELVPFTPPKYQHYVNVAVILLGGVAIIYTKTFHNTTITPSSAAKL